MADLLGRVTIDANGEIFRTKKGSKLNVGGEKLTTTMDTIGDAHTTGELMPSSCECTVLHTTKEDAVRLGKLRGVTLNFRGNGISYVVRNASVVDPPDVNDDGEITLKFEGNPAIRQ